jgi:hypothetical protein
LVSPLGLEPPGLTLTAARKEAKAILGAVARGGDPLTARRKAERAGSNTLKAVVEEYLVRDGTRLRTIGQRCASFERHVLPKLGDRLIDDITRTDIIRLLDRIADRTGAPMADHVLAYLRRVMTWHASRSDDFRSPIVRGMARTRPSQRRCQRVLSDDELKAVWRVTEASQSAFGYLVRFLLLTATRCTESAAMRRTRLPATNGSFRKSATRRDSSLWHGLAIDSELAGNRGYRDALPMQFQDHDQFPNLITAPSLPAKRRSISESVRHPTFQRMF